MQQQTTTSTKSTLFKTGNTKTLQRNTLLCPLEKENHDLGTT